MFARAARAQGLHGGGRGAPRGDRPRARVRGGPACTGCGSGRWPASSGLLRADGVGQAVLAGGFSRMPGVAAAPPGPGPVPHRARLRSFRDDALLRAAAAEFESAGVRIVAPTGFLTEVLAPPGLLAGPPLGAGQERDLAARRGGGPVAGPGRRRTDGGGEGRPRAGAGGGGGHRRGHPPRGGAGWARRGGGEAEQAGTGRAVRPARGRAGHHRRAGRGGRRVLAVEAGKTLLLETEALLRDAGRAGISVVAR